MRIRMFPVAALLMLAPFARAADVTGKWRGTAEAKLPDGQTQVIGITAEFKQHDKSVSGTTGKEGEEQYPIEKGHVDGGQLSFAFFAPEADEDSGKRTYVLRLNVISETQLQGEFEAMAGGGKIMGKVALARAK